MESEGKSLREPETIHSCCKVALRTGKAEMLRACILPGPGSSTACLLKAGAWIGAEQATGDVQSHRTWRLLFQILSIYRYIYNIYIYLWLFIGQLSTGKRTDAIHPAISSGPWGGRDPSQRAGDGLHQGQDLCHERCQETGTAAQSSQSSHLQATSAEEQLKEVMQEDISFKKNWNNIYRI